MAVELRADVFASTGHELASQVMALASPEKFRSTAAADRWLQRTRASVSPELRDVLADLALAGTEGGGLWSGLSDLSYVRRWSSVDELIRGIESEPEDELIIGLAGLEDVPGLREQLGEVVLKAAAGDREAASELAQRGPALGHCFAPTLAEGLLRVGPGLRERLLKLVLLWRRDVMAPDEERLTAVLARDADAKRALAKRLSAEDLLEEATNGIVWTTQPGVQAIGLVPTWITRPWTYWGRWGDVMVVSYPVADASLGGDGDSTAASAVKLARVLADESRMRALQLLAQESLTLQELADRLGLRKSTVHHHLAELRAAGLLRIPMGTKRYAMRPEALDRFGELLAQLARPARPPRRRKTR